MKVTIKSWESVATWNWIANDQDCGICRNPFESTCPNCVVPGDDCPLAFSVCTHAFHLHCIVKWLNVPSSNGLCPMCRTPWEFSTH